LIQNDHYDSEDDFREGKAPGKVDAVWSGVFAGMFLLWLLWYAPLISMLAGLLFLAGMLYQHPAVRLKSRFCLSYKAEGMAALAAFCIGAAEGSGFAAGVDIWLPCLLVFGGGTVVSIPKDYKDVEADRRAGIPTYYVVLTGKGKSELAVHRWIVACVAICLLVPPVGLLVFFPSSWAAWLLFPLALGPGAALLLVEDRRRSLSVMLSALTIYLVVLAIAL
jgi:4-hydroxybenzoate polyprenyltransferase